MASRQCPPAAVFNSMNPPVNSYVEHCYLRSPNVMAEGMSEMPYCHQTNLMTSHHGFGLAQASDHLAGTDGSRFSTPRSTMKLSKKRAMSISPLSDASIDLQTMIRTSPNSLVAFINSRCPSASGSYGHLSIGTISPSLGYQNCLNHQRPQGGSYGNNPLMSYNSHEHLSSRGVGMLQPRSTVKHCQLKSEPLSSTGLDSIGSKRLDDVSEGDISSPASVGTQDPLLGLLDGRDDLEKDDGKHEPEIVYETNCHWESCTKEFDTQEHLVHHINNEHIHGEKKEFVCHWQDCSRELRPFKAQYMLVVHMRRHTGEKPHKCTKPYVCKIPGCTKRYTDPSSLRKHVKTVHGPEAHITKKHRGDGMLRAQPGHEGPGNQNVKGENQLDMEASSACKEDGRLAVPDITLKSQPSPGGQSSCSSERSPLGSTNNNDSGVEMNANTGGSFEDLTNLDDIPSVDSMGTAGASALRKLENLRIDKLNQLRKTPSSGKMVKLPSIHNSGPQGDMSVVCGPLGMSHNQHGIELPASSHVNHLNDRRNSTTSTMSSAYTVSRRSSVVSPYPPNQRAGDSGNMVDSYDISTDPSGHSNEAVCASGLPGLTPAQQYRLKAKYAAATGGPPPTPLPNMERMNTNNRMAFASSDYRGSAISSLQRRHSSNEYHNYGTGIIHPAQAPGAGIRRASDPARTGGDIQAVPKVQRFKSMTNMNVSMMGRQGTSIQQAYGGSDANLQRHMFSPRPPSITENVFMETAGPDEVCHTKEQGFIQSNEMQHYMNYQGQGSQLTAPNDHMNFNPQIHGLDGQSQNVYSHSQRAISNMHLNAENYSGQSNVSNFNQCQMTAHNQHFQNTRQAYNCANLPVQWNEVSSGTMDNPVQRPNHQIMHQNMSPGNHCQSQLSNCTVPESTKQGCPVNRNSCQQGMYMNNQKYNHGGQVQVKPEQQFHHSAPAMMSCQNMKHPSRQEHHFTKTNTMPLSSEATNCDYQGQQDSTQNSCFNVGLNPNLLSPPGRRSQTPIMQVKEIMVRNYVQSQQALMWEQHPKSMAMMTNSGDDVDTGQNQHKNTPNAAVYMGPKYMNYQGKPSPNNLMSPSSQDSQSSHTKAMGSPSSQCYNFDMMPHPPCGPKPLSRQHSVSSQSTYMGSPNQLSPSYQSSESSPRRMACLPPIQPQSEVTNNTSMMYYTGQMEMHQSKPGVHKLTTPLNLNQTSCDGHQHGQYNASHSFLKTVPYTSSCPAANTLDSLDLENTQIDFTAIIDDADNALMPGNISPNVLAGSSQASSHLTTLRNTGAVVPNMVVGDLNSMLSSLAGENKYLNTMS
ncbi:zinc finger protein GLI1 isoform X4 [Xenopus laevis]|uniref:Zinc finger protein GLI1 isoform X4 n=1 Tax=Xenopus laevis TaxID=8355 RepID=A0A8J0ULS0_XENLA|nr:zinc finger protein GLI1 isoform X4 [Xenopus laevis]